MTGPDAGKIVAAATVPAAAALLVVLALGVWMALHLRRRRTLLVCSPAVLGGCLGFRWAATSCYSGRPCPGRLVMLALDAAAHAARSG